MVKVQLSTATYSTSTVQKSFSSTKIQYIEFYFLTLHVGSTYSWDDRKDTFRERATEIFQTRLANIFLRQS